KRQLKSKRAPLTGVQIPRVVPPFGLVIRMIEVVAWKIELVTRDGRLILGDYRLHDDKNREYCGCNRLAINLHALPQPGSVERQCALDNILPAELRTTLRTWRP